MEPFPVLASTPEKPHFMQKTHILFIFKVRNGGSARVVGVWGDFFGGDGVFHFNLTLRGDLLNNTTEKPTKNLPKTNEKPTKNQRQTNDKPTKNQRKTNFPRFSRFHPDSI